MRLETYLTEYNEALIARLRKEELIDELCKNIKQDCKYFLSILKPLKNTDVLYRGMTTGAGAAGKKEVRQDREPKGMPIHHAKALNQFLVANKHVDRSKAMLATSNEAIAAIFGRVYYVFPIGKFNYTWFNSKKESDVNFDYLFKRALEEYEKRGRILSILHNSKSGKNFSKDIKQQEEWRNKAENELKPYFITNKRINAALREGKEIWFDCKSYYYIYQDWISAADLKEKLFS